MKLRNNRLSFRIVPVCIFLSLAGCGGGSGQSAGSESPEQGGVEVTEGDDSQTREPGAPESASRSLDPGLHEWVPVADSEVAEKCGLSPQLLREADRELGLRSYVVIRHGRLCHEHRNSKGQFHVASITKFMSSLLVGIATTRSQLSDESPVIEYLDVEELDGINANARVAHVLAMISTKDDLSWNQKGTWRYDAFGWREIDKLIPIVETAIEREPSAFPSIETIDDLARKALFDRLGMQNTSWSGDTMAHGMRSNLRDVARLGLLLLRGGVWNGERIVDEQYIYRMGHPSFPDINTGYGYLLMMNARENWTYSSGDNDPDCAPVSIWNHYPHAPFFEAKTCNNAKEACSQDYDVGIKWAAGFGGHKVVVHPGLDLVMVIRDDWSNNGHNNVWDAVRPALVELDPVYAGNEAAFCRAYSNNEYAPDL